MVNYSNGKIYKIQTNLGDEVYIGSTTKQYLSQRFDRHRSSYKSWKDGKCNKVMVYDIFDKYGTENCSIILLETFPCESSDELHAREAHYVKQLSCVNKYIPCRTKAEYYIDHKENLDKRNKENYKENRQHILDNHATICECECGKSYTRGHRSRHIQSKRHLNLIANK